VNDEWQSSLIITTLSLNFSSTSVVSIVSLRNISYLQSFVDHLVPATWKMTQNKKDIVSLSPLYMQSVIHNFQLFLKWTCITLDKLLAYLKYTLFDVYVIVLTEFVPYCSTGCRMSTAGIAVATKASSAARSLVLRHVDLS